VRNRHGVWKVVHERAVWQSVVQRASRETLRPKQGALRRVRDFDETCRVLQHLREKGLAGIGPELLLRFVRDVPEKFGGLVLVFISRLCCTRNSRCILCCTRDRQYWMRCIWSCISRQCTRHSLCILCGTRHRQCWMQEATRVAEGTHPARCEVPTGAPRKPSASFHQGRARLCYHRGGDEDADAGG
jgi:hypothetical protein